MSEDLPVLRQMQANLPASIERVGSITVKNSFPELGNRFHLPEGPVLEASPDDKERHPPLP